MSLSTEINQLDTEVCTHGSFRFKRKACPQWAFGEAFLVPKAPLRFSILIQDPDGLPPSNEKERGGSQNRYEWKMPHELLLQLDVPLSLFQALTDPNQIQIPHQIVLLSYVRSFD